MSQPNADLNVTPFLDILLVLLIMFMVMFPLSRRAIDAQLPDPDAVGDPSQAVPIVLEVGPGGRYAINREPVDSASLKTRLLAVYAPRPDKRLLVRGARAATYQEVITAMDVARSAGVTVLGLDPDRARP